MTEPYLQHYGVLGMKWGIRKAAKYNAKAGASKQKKYHYESLNTKIYNKRYKNSVKKYGTDSSVAQKYQRLTKRQQSLDSREVANAKKTSVSKVLATRIAAGVAFGGIAAGAAIATGGASAVAAAVAGGLRGVTYASTIGSGLYNRQRARGEGKIKSALLALSPAASIAYGAHTDHAATKNNNP